MRVLLVSNWSTVKCGVAEWGRQQEKALLRAGVEVVCWEPTLPQHWPDAGRYAPVDLIHVNFHPTVMGFITPPPPPHPPISVFKHEPPGGCSLEPIAKWIFAAEQALPHYTLFPMPCVSYHSPRSDEPPIKNLIGFSSLRRAGLDMVQPVAEGLGLTVDSGQGKDWWPIEREVDRLAQCELLVYWYGGAFSGQSAGVMTGVAAERPMLLNGNRMFDSLATYKDELYYNAPDLEPGIRIVLDLIRNHPSPRIPRRLKRERNWESLIPIMVDAWRRG